MLSSLRASTCAVPVKAGAYPRPNSVGTAGRRPSAVPTRSTPSRPLRLRAAAPEAPSTPARPKTPAELPPDLRNPVVVLRAPNPAAPGGATDVYVLGISHVAKSDCKRVRDLVSLVKPDIVLVELCKERTGLLVDPSLGTSGLWHTPQVAVQGLPVGKGWPTEQQLLGLLAVKPHDTITLADMEDERETLCSTGLFRNVRLKISPPGPLDAPNFVPEVLPSGKERLRPVEPLGPLIFEVSERILPSPKQCNIEIPPEASALGQDSARKVATQLVEACAKGASAVSAAVAARADLIAAAEAAIGDGEVDVLIEGLDTGKPTLRLVVLGQGEAASLTGLEGSAPGGKGWGIEPLPRRSPRNAVSASPCAAAASRAALTALRPWTEAERNTSPAIPPPSSPLEEAFGMAVTRAYAALQADAGRSVGIAPGAAWRAAFEAAAAEGVQQVHLGDRPTDVTRRRLAAGMFEEMAAKTAGAALLLVGAAAAASVGALPEGSQAAAVGAAASIAGFALWPLVGPLIEVGRFSRLSAADIEEAVRVKVPLQGRMEMLKLWGEDAIVDFPGAKASVIEDRDAFMAKTLYSAATGGEGAAPAYVLTADGKGLAYRYAIPEGGPQQSCPVGAGNGAFQPHQMVSAVVAVVGTAHVHGIVSKWEEVASQPRDNVMEPLLSP